jgi:two-component system, NarL family, invasion response regulator UvrY
VKSAVGVANQRIAPNTLNDMVKILIADDHSLIREGLKKILKTAPEMTVIAEAGDAREVIQNLKNHEIDIVVLDISLPGKNGLDLLKDIKTEYPRLPVLMLSMHPEDRFAVRALKAGASGYVTKETASEELITAIRKVMQGRKHVSAEFAEKLAFKLDDNTDKPVHELLSDREFQVMRLIAAGRTVRQISEELFLSMSTVNTYRARILEKMKIKTDAELIRYAIENQLID